MGERSDGATIVQNIILPSLLIAVILGFVALFSVVAQEALIAPSRASAVFSQILHPDEASAKPANIASGQLMGVGAGFLAVWLVGSIGLSPLMGDQELLYRRALAVALAALLTSLAQSSSGIKTPSGGATALVVAMGLETVTWLGAARLLIGIALVTAMGEAGRRFLLRWRFGASRLGPN